MTKIAKNVKPETKKTATAKKTVGRSLNLKTAKVVQVYRREGSFAKAAAKLGCSASTVKYHVRKSEVANVW